MTIQLSDLGLKLSSEQEKLLQQFQNEMLEHNKRFNLTAITDPQEVVVKHFYDSLLVAKLKQWTGEGKMADLGTGAGFPGLPLKMVYPNLDAYLFDSSQKKIRFIEQAKEKLCLERVYGVHMRAEDAGQSESYRESFDWVVTRAVGSIPVLLEYGLPLLKVGGSMVIYKGPGWQEEWQQSKRALSLLGGLFEEAYEDQLPLNYGHRTLILVKKAQSTPKSYPRKAGLPAKKPL